MQAFLHKQLSANLIDLVHEITYDWTQHGSVQDDGPERIAEVAAAESRGVYLADAVIVLLPGGRGTHAELGMAYALGKRIFIHGPRAGEDGRECAFYYAQPGSLSSPTIPPIITHHEGTLAELAIAVQKWAQGSG